MKKIKLKFVKDKGSVKKGYVGFYDRDIADKLIMQGVAMIDEAFVTKSTKTNKSKLKGD